MKTYSVAQAIHVRLTARANCERMGNNDWRDRWETKVKEAEDYLPHGSGFDVRITADRDAVSETSFRLSGSFHLMNEHGSYIGWRDFVVIVRPCFDGIRLQVTGKMPKQLRDFIGDALQEALTTEFDGSVM